MNKRSRNRTLVSLSGIVLTLFLLSGGFIFFNWISINKNLIFKISGILLLLFVIIGSITLNKMKKSFKRKLKKIF